MIVKGYIQVYTGNGKGKTTCAIGLCVRAAGAGLTVLIAQFLKSGDYSEVKALKQFRTIALKQFGTGRFIKGSPSPEDIRAAAEGLAFIRNAISSGRYDMIVLEEANVAVTCGVLKLEDLLDIMAHKPDHLELVITGRNADPKVIELADLVTEMKEVKHYYHNGVQARVGIEK
jgi:cob(I)alamin adenosyltransferase